MNHETVVDNLSDLIDMVDSIRTQMYEAWYWADQERDVESEVDDLMDQIETIHKYLAEIHDYYRSKDEWEGERWR